MKYLAIMLLIAMISFFLIEKKDIFVKVGKFVIDLNPGNTNTDLLYPEFWAASFDELDTGLYTMHNYVSKRGELTTGKKGDTLNVPLQVDMGDADDYTPGSAITKTSVTQETFTVTLDQSKNKTFQLNETERTMSAYDLVKDYGVPAAESILKAVNSKIYNEAVKSKYFTKEASPDEDDIVDIRTKLTKRDVSKINRHFFLSPDEYGTMLKRDAFQYQNQSGDPRVMTEGEIQRKFGFTLHEESIIEDYTPADLVGAVNNAGTPYAAGATTIVVDAFNDDANPIKAGDIFTIADETGTPAHTVISTLTTTDDTTSITFYPGIVDGAADDAAVNFEATRSGIAMVPSAIAMAAKAYELLPPNVGAEQSVIMYKGIPIRISIWQSELVLNVQFDILFGVSKVKDERIERLVV